MYIPYTFAVMDGDYFPQWETKMRLLIKMCANALVSACFASFAQAEPPDEKQRFATDTEIRLVLTQAERAMQQYRHVVEIEEQQLAKTSKPVDVSLDRKLIDTWNSIYGKLQSTPQLFNGPVGLDLVMMLDDSSRNAALGSNAALLAALNETVAGRVQHANLLLSVSQQADASSTLTYAVCESAGALYELFVGAMEELALSAASVADDCAKALKHVGEVKAAKKP